MFDITHLCCSYHSFQQFTQNAYHPYKPSPAPKNSTYDCAQRNRQTCMHPKIHRYMNTYVGLSVYDDGPFGVRVVFGSLERSNRKIKEKETNSARSNWVCCSNQIYACEVALRMKLQTSIRNSANKHLAKSGGNDKLYNRAQISLAIMSRRQHIDSRCVLSAPYVRAWL